MSLAVAAGLTAIPIVMLSGCPVSDSSAADVSDGATPADAPTPRPAPIIASPMKVTAYPAMSMVWESTTTHHERRGRIELAADAQGWIRIDDSMAIAKVSVHVTSRDQCDVGITERDVINDTDEVVLASASDPSPSGAVTVPGPSFKPGHAYAVELLCAGPATYGGTTIYWE